MSLTSRRGSKPFMKSTGNNFRTFLDNALGLFFLAVRQSKQACFALTRCVSFGPTSATGSASPSLSGTYGTAYQDFKDCPDEECKNYKYCAFFCKYFYNY